MRRLIAALSIALLAIPATSQKASTPKKVSTAQNKNGEESADSSKERLSALEKRVTDLESKVSFYKYLIDQKQVKYDSVQLDPSLHSFQRLDSDTSTFLVSVEDASPYLNGYRIKLSIGNPSSATFSGTKVKVRWARAYDFSKYTNESYKQWQDSIHEKEVPLTDALMPGVWNNVDLDLVPSAPDELGYLIVSMTSPSVILKKQ
jgi:hypothetical protein